MLSQELELGFSGCVVEWLVRKQNGGSLGEGVLRIDNTTIEKGVRELGESEAT